MWIKIANAMIVAGVCALALWGCTPPPASLETQADSATERYSDLCRLYGGAVDVEGWCRGARPASATTGDQVRVLLDIAETEAACLDLRIGGPPSHVIDAGETALTVALIPPYTPCVVTVEWDVLSPPPVEE